MPVTTFDPSEGPSPEQMAAEQAALDQGEKILQMQQEDRDRKFQQTEDENSDAALIGGKFKSQDDLLRAYNELQKKLGQPKAEGEEEAEEELTEATEEDLEEAPQEEEAVEVKETVNYMHQLGQEYAEKGQLSEEAIDKLASMDSKDLIKAYLQYNQQASAAQLQQAEINSIQESVGGPQAYNEMIGWAAENLSPQEIAEFNTVTNSNNPVAIKFAVAALANRYRSDNGFEAELVTGRKAAPQAKAYRSHAELSRDIADPRYSTDPAFRADVEAKLARSTDLL